MSKSTKIFLFLVILYAFLAALNLYLPQGSFASLIPAGYQYPAPKIVMALINGAAVLVIYGLLGFLGIKLSRKIGLPQIWDEKVSLRQRFLIPAMVGGLGGTFLIIGDLIFSHFNSFGRFIHPPFPTSLVASLAAGIGEEIIFRLFFISFWVWLLTLILKGRWQKQVFWVVAAVSALTFAVGHFPGLMMLLGFNAISQMPLVLQIEVILLNSVIALACAWCFRRFGFLAAAGVHFWADIFWHVLWGLV